MPSRTGFNYNKEYNITTSSHHISVVKQCFVCENEGLRFANNPTSSRPRPLHFYSLANQYHDAQKLAPFVGEELVRRHWCEWLAPSSPGPHPNWALSFSPRVPPTKRPDTFSAATQIFILGSLLFFHNFHLHSPYDPSALPTSLPACSCSSSLALLTAPCFLVSALDCAKFFAPTSKPQLFQYHRQLLLLIFGTSNHLILPGPGP